MYPLYSLSCHRAKRPRHKIQGLRFEGLACWPTQSPVVAAAPFATAVLNAVASANTPTTAAAGESSNMALGRRWSEKEARFGAATVVVVVDIPVYIRLTEAPKADAPKPVSAEHIAAAEQPPREMQTRMRERHAR